MQQFNAVGASVLFEDAGTNTQIDRTDDTKDNPDTDDAANLNQALRAVGLSDRVSHGLDVTYNGDDTVDISAGAAVINANSGYAAKARETRYDISYPVRVPSQSSVPLIPNAVNELYLRLPLTGDDELRIIARDPANDALPAEPSLLFATVDTTATSPVPTLESRGAELNVRKMTGGIADGGVVESLVGGDFTTNSANALVFDGGGGQDLSNAETLGGEAPSYYAALSETETVGAQWTFAAGLTTEDDIVDANGDTVYDHSAGALATSALPDDIDASTYKGRDIDSDGDGVVDAADSAALADDSARLGGTPAGNFARTDTAETFTSNVYIDNHGFGSAPAQIALAIGDNDTGLHSLTDGTLEIHANGEMVGQIESTYADFDSPLLEAGNRVATRSYLGSNYITGQVVSTGTVSVSGGVGRANIGVSGSKLNVDIEVEGGSVSGDCKVGARLVWNESAGGHDVEIVEQETSQDPNVSYRVWRAV